MYDQLYVEFLDWHTGKQVRSKFNADELVSTYQHHVNVINAIRDKRLVKFHRLMSNLYVEAMSVWFHEFKRMPSDLIF